jgi:hypothetical protein
MIYNLFLPLDMQLQITLEFGITNLFRESGKFSSASSYEKMEGSSISFTVPLLARHSIVQYLNVFCTYDRVIKDAADADAREEFDILYCIGDIYVKIKNKTKDLTWIYNPVTRYPTPFGKDKWEWWSRWRFGNQLNGGDEITVTFYPIRKYVHLNMCGYKIEVEEKGDGSTGNRNSHHHFPELRLSTGEYSLWHAYKQRPDEDYWFPKHSKRYFD